MRLENSTSQKIKASNLKNGWHGRVLGSMDQSQSVQIGSLQSGYRTTLLDQLVVACLARARYNTSCLAGVN